MKIVITLMAAALMAAITQQEPQDEKSGAKKSTEEKTASAAPAEKPRWRPLFFAKPLSVKVRRGLAWLVQAQNEDGGWAQGEAKRTRRPNEKGGYGHSNVGDTCMAVLALLRSGDSPSKGEHAEIIRRGLAFVCSAVEQADDDSLWVTSIRPTRLQVKLGQYVDTFLAALLLPTVEKQIEDPGLRGRVKGAIAKTMKKIERNQQRDGSWAAPGWAGTLQQGLASKALNNAVQLGYDVDEAVRGRAEDFARDQFNGGTFAGSRSAGVDLYATGAVIGAVSDSAVTNELLRSELEKKAESGETKGEREEARETLDRFEKNQRDLDAQRQAVVAKLGDQRFIAGFGSNGGEEFLSFMNISESLVVENDDTWKKWDEAVTGLLERVQNEDGSWSGHHCITGRTFCTSAALLTLMTDRAPVRIAAEVAKR